jgi:hypothetical protein
MSATTAGLLTTESVLGVLQQVTPTKPGNWTALCPAHSDHSPSLDIKDSGGTALFVCRAGCDQTLLADEIKSRILANGANRARRSDRFWEPAPPKKAVLTSTDREVAAHEAALAAELEAPSDLKSFLAQRGVSIGVAKELRLGFAPAVRFTCKQKCDQCGRRSALTIPLFFKGELVGVKCRNIKDDEHKWTQATGSAADLLYGVDLPPVNDSGTVMVFEGELEVALARSHGFNAVAICSVSAVPSGEPSERFQESLRLLRQKYSQIVLVGDNDHPGQQAMDRLERLLPGCRRARFAGVKDLGELFTQSRDPETFKAAIQELLAAPSPEPASAESSLVRTLPGGPVDLEMPEQAMYERLGELARLMQMPLGLAYPALLGCYSILPDDDEMAGTRINLYVALLAPVGGGKNQAIKRGLLSLGVPEQDYRRAAPASDRGLMNLAGEPSHKNGPPIPGPRKLLLVTNEMSDVLRKTQVQNSTLASTLCDFWDENRKEVADRNGVQAANCRLSWIGGIPIKLEAPDEFGELFGRETGRGLFSRMILGFSEKKFNYKPWSPPTATDPWSECNIWGADQCLRVDLSSEATELADTWQPEEEDAGRLKFNLNKVALLTADANRDPTVSLKCMTAALEFMKWQQRLKSVFRIGHALERSVEAQFCDALLAALQQLGAATQSVNLNRLVHDRKWHRKYGAGVVNRGKSQLIQAGELILDPARPGHVFIQREKP